MSECTHDCSSCSENCASRQDPKDLIMEQNENSNIKHVVAVVSGKGGVGKSLVTSLLAVAAHNKGKSVAILDADITGPSIPKAFGVNDRIMQSEFGILPATTKTGIELMSTNLLLENEDDPVVWRGPVISGVIGQFWSDVVWGDIDYMFVDMPPGTGDVPLTVFQSLPIAGIVVVTTPQDLVTLIVKKAYKMAKLMNVPILGIVENMSYFTCDECGKKHYLYGESKLEEVAKDLGVDVLAQLPIKPVNAKMVDAGTVELADTDDIEAAVDAIMEKLDD
ncbi:MAG: Mrp/NBP35 family ATP-binding protein [Clostridia bacterium]|nr:Mrp/NBP35 family ATP-binding protein [Clostridia bacterium]